MKTMGLQGATSWPSTIEYYRLLNELPALLEREIAALARLGPDCLVPVINPTEVQCREAFAFAAGVAAV